MIKYYAIFDDNKASEKFNEYLHFHNMLRNFANLPKNGIKHKLKRADTVPLLRIEDMRIAELIRLLPLKLHTFEKKIRIRIEFLRATDSDFIIIMFLEHILDLLRNPEFRDLVVTKRTPMIRDPKRKNSE